MTKLYKRRTNEHGFFDNPAPIQTDKLCGNMEYNVYVELVGGQDSKTMKLPEPIVDARVMNNKQDWVTVTLVSKKCVDNGMVWYLDEDGYRYAY